MLATATAVSAETIWHLAAEGMAEVLVVAPDDVLKEVAMNGDCVITSKDAEVVISYVEELLSDVELVDQSHLGRRELTSLRTLSALLWRRWTELHGGEENR